MKKLICVLFGILACARLVGAHDQGQRASVLNSPVKGRGKTSYPGVPGCKPLAQVVEVAKLQRDAAKLRPATVPIVASAPVVVVLASERNVSSATESSVKKIRKSKQVGKRSTAKPAAEPRASWPVSSLACEFEAAEAVVSSSVTQDTEKSPSMVVVPEKETDGGGVKLEPVGEPVVTVPLTDTNSAMERVEPVYEAATKTKAMPVPVFDDTTSVEQVFAEGMTASVEKEKTEDEEKVVAVTEAVPNPMIIVPLNNTNSAAVRVEPVGEVAPETKVMPAVESAPTGCTDAFGIVSALVEEMIASIEKEKNQNEEKVAAPRLTPMPAPATVPIAVMERVPNPLLLMPAVRSSIAVNSSVVPVVVAPPKLLPEPQPVTTTQPIVAPALTEEEANTLNTVLLEASGIVMMTPALVYLMYLLVTKRIAPQYEQLAAVLQSREVRSRLTSLSQAKMIATALAPVFLVAGGAMVYAGHALKSN
ncbi:MAG: hypothetical protein QG604_941 [Candidatus Dependentiae bacterium]|nr:hypothetical protein [Candidatus Dependentiae bacterium]